MKTKFNKVVTFITAACLTLTTVAFAACEPETTPEDFGDPSKDGYIVTVLYPDGSPVKGSDADFHLDRVSAELTDNNGDIVNPAARANLNESGIAQINYTVPGEYYIKLNDIPSGYAFDNTSVKTTVDKAYYTVSLELAGPTPYTVTLNAPDGMPMSGVGVKLMNGATEVTSATTNAQGIAVTPTVVRGNYSVELDLPDGYGHRPVSVSVGTTSVTVDVVRLTAISFDDGHLLNEDGIKPWDDALNWYYPDKDNPTTTNIKFNTDADCYAYNLELDEGEEAFYTITAPKTGSYTIASKQGNDYKIMFYQNDLTGYDDSLTISSKINNGNNVQNMRIEEGNILTFSVQTYSGDAGTVELLVCQPVPEPEMTIATSPDNYTLNFAEDMNTAILRFNIAEMGSGVFEIDVVTDLEIEMNEYAQTGHMVRENIQLPYTMTIKNSEVGGYTDFHIIIKDVSALPAHVNFTIKRTGDAPVEREETDTVQAHVSTPFADQTGTFTWMPFKDTIAPEPYEKDGLWFVNDNGTEKPLVVAITKELLVYVPGELNDSGIQIKPPTRTPVYSFATIEYFGEDSGESGTPSAEKQNSKLIISKTTSSATEILTVKTDYSKFIETYSKFVNSDGVYQVNTELKAFLDAFMDIYHFDFTGDKTKPAQPWLLACGYYA